MNKWNGVGRLGDSPKGVDLPSGTRKATFPISVIGEKKKTTDGWEDLTLWLTITAFGQQAENAEQILKVGDLVEIDGRLTKNTWEEDGQPRSMLNIVANRWTLIPTGNVGSEGTSAVDNSNLGF